MGADGDPWRLLFEDVVLDWEDSTYECKETKIL